MRHNAWQDGKTDGKGAAAVSMELLIFIQYRISMAFLLGFLWLFVPRRYKPAPSLLLLLGCFALTAGADYVRVFLTHTDGMKLTDTLLQSLLVQSTAILLSDYRDFRTLFTGITATAYTLAGNVIGSVVLLHTGLPAASIAAQAATHLALLAFLCLRVRSDSFSLMSMEGMPWAALCLIPALFYLLIYTLMIWPSDIYKIPSNQAAALAVLLLMVVGYVLIIRMLTSQREAVALRHDAELLETYADSLRAEAAQLEHSEEKTAVLRHDIRHRAALISGYLDAGQTDKVRALLATLDESLRAARPRHYCDNLALNGVVAHGVERAAALGVPLELQLAVPSSLGRLNEFELATVLSNLLENALTAAAELPPALRRATVRCFQARAQLVLEVSNPYVGERKISAKTGLPVSRRGTGHGFGLRSVQTFAEKSGAVFTYSTGGGVFCVRLLADL